jgi:hypothetical protein
MSNLNRRKQWLLAGILILIVLNVWRWWPVTPTRPGHISEAGVSHDTSKQLRVDEFVVHVLPMDTPPPLQRDLFRPKLSPRPVTKSLAKPAEPPPKSPQELARDAAQAELAQLRCVGVAFRGGKAQAFLQKGSDSYLVSQGDKVINRFIVETISAEAVTLQDPDTGVGGTLAVSGK